MQIEIFTICDFAQNYGDKLVLSGVVNRVFAEKVPSIGPALSVVVRTSYEPGEDGDKEFELSFLDPEGKEWLPKGNFNSKVVVNPNHGVANTNLVITIAQPLFKLFGCYTINLKTENQARSIKLFVQQVQKKQ